MKLSRDRYTLHPKAPFSISRSTVTAYDRVRVRVSAGGHEGWGEAAPNAYYGESADTVLAALPRLARVLAGAKVPRTLDDIAVIERRFRPSARSEGSALPDASARAAVSAALHDLLGKTKGQPVHALFGLDPMLAPPSSFTIAITTNEADLRQRIEDARAYPLLKIKLGTDRDEWIVETLRRLEPRKIMRADANAGWSRERAASMVPLLAAHGFELVEQPLVPDDHDGLRALTGLSPIPIIADESCRTTADVPALDGVVSGINIKLSKCGGLAEAAAMARDARARGMKVMLGCMVESTLGVAALAQLAPLADYVDLDGAALLADDPFTGVAMREGMLYLSSEAGLGVRLREGVATRGWETADVAPA